MVAVKLPAETKVVVRFVPLNEMTEADVKPVP